MEPLLRRESYLALLVERPDVQRRLLRLLDLARWPMQYLMRHPGVIDELADERLLHLRFDREAFVRELDERRAALGTLRRGRRGTAARHAAPRPPCRGLPHAGARRRGRAHASSRWPTTCRRWPTPCSTPCSAGPGACTAKRHRDDCGLAVIAYGKLGGKELGYGSDLDVVFLYDDGDEADKDRAQEVYGAFVRKLITWLTLRTAAGELFDIDTALRPNGNSGLLVTSIASFETYQGGRGSNTAWTWEHQAHHACALRRRLRRVAARFEATRRAVLTAARDPAALREEVRAMREKVRAARPVPAGQFDVKHSAGGMMDVEFAVQYLVLAHGATQPALLDNAGNIALLQRAEGVGLLPAGVGTARGRCLPRAAPGPAPRAAGRAADAVRARALCGSVTRCWRCGRRCSPA
jgi:glutamate-ammonia-ligase adenylyltransferase